LLNVSEFGPRKNLAGLLRAWLRATSCQDGAVLLLKLSWSGPRQERLLRAQMEQVEREVGRQFDQAAPIRLIEAIYSDREMRQLYAAATHYMSLSFGEGWDQALFEAAASGLKLIAPRHSAYLAYLDADVAQLVAARQAPVEFGGDPATALLFEGASWWQPDEAQAVACLRTAIDGRDSHLRSVRERLLADFTWERATRCLIELLEEALANRKRRRFWQWPGRSSRA
jgi:glycosyltransferase involved in cell wall biosynthesis